MVGDHLVFHAKTGGERKATRKRFFQQIQRILYRQLRYPILQRQETVFNVSRHSNKLNVNKWIEAIESEVIVVRKAALERTTTRRCTTTATTCVNGKVCIHCVSKGKERSVKKQNYFISKKLLAASLKLQAQSCSKSLYLMARGL